MKRAPDHLLIPGPTTERIVAVGPGGEFETLCSVGIAECSQHAWCGNGTVAIPVRGGRRILRWQVTATGQARRLPTVKSPVAARALVAWRESLLIAGSPRQRTSPMWVGRSHAAGIDWKPVELFSDAACSSSYEISALACSEDTVVAACEPDALFRIDFAGPRARVDAVHRLDNTPDAAVRSIHIGESGCVVWSVQRRHRCHPPGVDSWNKFTLHELETLELIGEVDRLPTGSSPVAYRTSRRGRTFVCDGDKVSRQGR